jgi:hypothetical protein
LAKRLGLDALLRITAISLARVFSRRLDGNNGAEQHLDATIAPQRKQEARVAARMFDICFSGCCLTIISGGAALDSRLALQGQPIERRLKINFVKKLAAYRLAVPVGQVRPYEIEAEPKGTFKDVNQRGFAPEPRSQSKLDVIPKRNVVCTTLQPAPVRLNATEIRFKLVGKRIAVNVSCHRSTLFEAWDYQE